MDNVKKNLLDMVMRKLSMDATREKQAEVMHPEKLGTWDRVAGGMQRDTGSNLDKFREGFKRGNR